MAGEESQPPCLALNHASGDSSRAGGNSFDPKVPFKTTCYEDILSSSWSGHNGDGGDDTIDIERCLRRDAELVDIPHEVR